MQAGITACEELMSCKKFMEILSLILSIGNFMNSSSSNGQTVGFEFSILTKLNEIKSSDKIRTLLRFIVEHVKSRMPDLLSFGDGLCHVQEATSINVQNIKETIQNMVTLSGIVEEELDHSKFADLSPDDKFQDVMSSFALQSSAQLKMLQKMMDEMQRSYIQVGEYFTFNVNRYRMEECFVDVSTFKNMFAHTYEELAKHHEMDKMLLEKCEAQKLTNNQPGDRQQQEIERNAGEYILRD